MCQKALPDDKVHVPPTFKDLFSLFKLIFLVLGHINVAFPLQGFARLSTV